MIKAKTRDKAAPMIPPMQISRSGPHFSSKTDKAVIIKGVQ